MKPQILILCFLTTSFFLFANKDQHGKIVLKDNFSKFEKSWFPESEKSFKLSYSKKGDYLDVVAEKGFTLWYIKPLKKNFTISFKAYLVREGGEFDRVSDLNFFWMARDPLYPDNILARSGFRGGVFGKYYSLDMYYLGIGGNNNTTTRFRDYNGNYDDFAKEGKRPEVIFEYTDSLHLLKPGHWYEVFITVFNNRTTVSVDGIEYVNYIDLNMPEKGWFGFRTTQNHLRLSNFTIEYMN